MEAAHSSQTSVHLYETAWYRVLEDHYLLSRILFCVVLNSLAQRVGFNQKQILILFFTHWNIFRSLDICGTHFQHWWCWFYHVIRTIEYDVLQDAWYYDELDMQEMEGFDDPDPDSDYDYEESYSKRKGKKRTSKVARNTDSPAAKKPKVM